MRIELKLPDLTEFPKGFPDYWLNIIFTNNQPLSYKVRAIITSYVRLVEAAMTEYCQARSLIHAVWNDNLSTRLGDHNRAVANFEACLTNMHRAVRFMIQIRRRIDIPKDLKSQILPKPQFTEARISDRIRNVRDAIHHLDEKIIDGSLSENTPFALQATGPETPIPDEPGQTLKAIDRLKIGRLEIKLMELHKWLVEMGRCAEQISLYEGQKRMGPSAASPPPVT